MASVDVRAIFTTAVPTQSRNQKPEYLAQRRKGRQGMRRQKKLKTRNPKFETNPNDEKHKFQTSWFWISDLGVSACFGFRASDFGF
jgi:hypothetical protein